MDKEYLKQVKSYLMYTGRLNSSFNNYSRMYNMTTENIYGFLKNYDLKDKKILTVGSSGDQRLNAYLLGAKNVTCFDSNPLSLLQMKLKDAAILNLTFQEFIDFFGIDTDKFITEYDYLDLRLLERMNDDLDYDAFDFFRYIIDNHDTLKKDDIYFKFEDKLNILNKANGYLNEGSYLKLRKNLKDKSVDFMCCDVTELPDLLSYEKFDMILLSNISDYINQLYDDDYLFGFSDLIYKLSKHLNSYGIIQVGYMYYHNKGSVDKVFYDNSTRHLFFPTSKFHTVVVDSFDIKDKKDKIITYQKF